MGICQNLVRKKKQSIIKANEKENISKKQNKKNENFIITHNEAQFSNFPTAFSDTSPKSKILSSPQYKNSHTPSNISSNSISSPSCTPQTYLIFKIEATIGEFEIPIYIEKNENIIIKINENNKWSFLPNENPIDYLGYENYKYKDINIGSFFLRISGSQKMYHLNKRINPIKVDSKGNLLFSANLNPNDYSLYEPKGTLEISIIGGNYIYEKELNSPYDNNNVHIKHNIFNLNIIKETIILEYINKARDNIFNFFEDYINIYDEYEENTELKEFVNKNNFKRKELNKDDKLTKIAQTHCEYLSNNGTTGEIGIDLINIQQKIKQNSSIYFSGVNIIYGINNPLLIVKRMILDKYSKSKKNRTNILFRHFGKIGICLKEHISYKYCCVIAFSD